MKLIGRDVVLFNNLETIIEDKLLVETDTLYVNGGQVGIKTLTPTKPLDVNGDIKTSVDYKISGNSVLTSTTLGSSVVNSSLTSLGTLSSATITGDLSVNSDNLYVSSAFNRVGVNQIFPTQPLDITGNINTTGFMLKEGINLTPYVNLAYITTTGLLSRPTGAWTKASINNKRWDTHNICTLSSSQFTIPAGTYHIKTQQTPAFCGLMKGRVYNVTDTSVLCYSTSISTAGNYNFPTCNYIFTIGSSKTFELQFYFTTSGSEVENGYNTDVTNQVELWQLY